MKYDSASLKMFANCYDCQQPYALETKALIVLSQFETVNLSVIIIAHTHICRR